MSRLQPASCWIKGEQNTTRPCGGSDIGGGAGSALSSPSLLPAAFQPVIGLKGDIEDFQQSARACFRRNHMQCTRAGLYPRGLGRSKGAKHRGGAVDNRHLCARARTRWPPRLGLARTGLGRGGRPSRSREVACMMGRDASVDGALGNGQHGPMRHRSSMHWQLDQY